jgi:hypothetical protein
MHYANGKEAKLGDLVFKPAAKGFADTEIIGVLVSANESQDTCNGLVQPLAVRFHSDLGTSPWSPGSSFGNGWTVTVTLKDLLPLDVPIQPPNT